MSADLTKASLAELFASYSAVLGELKRREIVRTENAPAGDYAEYLVCKTLAGTLAPSSKRSFDLTAPSWGRIRRAVLVPVLTIQQAGSYREHVNGHVVHARAALLDAVGNTDITDAVLTALASL